MKEVPMQAIQTPYYTPEAYLSLESEAQERHEYIDGEIIPMVGGLPNHNLIIGNLFTALNLALKRQPYYVFVTDQRLWIPQQRIYTYPDVMVITGEIGLQAGRQDTVTNPLMIAEVLSASTQGYDRGEKFQAYRTIASFQEYILISQDKMQVEVYQKMANQQWLLSEWQGREAVFSLASFPFSLALEDLYEKVNI
jgi:Uma2 family endonuclease